MKVAILGAAGRMGQMLVKLAEADANLEVVAQIDVAPGFDSTWPAGTEAVVDFSFHTAVAPNVEKALIIGKAQTSDESKSGELPSLHRRLTCE